MTLFASAFGEGCAKPIKTEYYSRTPKVLPEWRFDKSSKNLFVGVGIDSPRLVAYGDSSAAPQSLDEAIVLARQEASDAALAEQAAAFVNYASRAGVFDKIAFVSLGNIQSLDCQLELMLSFEHAGDSQVHYCLGRLIANVYDTAHSRLLGRVIKFHEAMYTSAKNIPDATHDNDHVPSNLRNRLFDELIDEFRSACGEGPTASVASQPTLVGSR